MIEFNIFISGLYASFLLFFNSLESYITNEYLIVKYHNFQKKFREYSVLITTNSFSVLKTKILYKTYMLFLVICIGLISLCSFIEEIFKIKNKVILNDSNLNTQNWLLIILVINLICLAGLKIDLKESAKAQLLKAINTLINNRNYMFIFSAIYTILIFISLYCKIDSFKVFGIEFLSISEKSLIDTRLFFYYIITPFTWFVLKIIGLALIYSLSYIPFLAFKLFLKFCLILNPKYPLKSLIHILKSTSPIIIPIYIIIKALIVRQFQ